MATFFTSGLFTQMGNKDSLEHLTARVTVLEDDLSKTNAKLATALFFGEEITTQGGN